MEITAKAKHIRMSARKVRLVADVVRGSQVEKALAQLKFINKLAAGPVAKVINSAIASAEHNYSLEKSNLFVKEIRIDEGQTLDRWMPKAHGRATPIRKKASHINVVLAEIKDSGVRKAKEQKLEAPVKLGEKPKQDDGIKVDRKEKSEPTDAEKEKGAKLNDPRDKTGRSGHLKNEGSNTRGFVGKMFNRKAG
ncbi:MAG: 50S ribosomal protein L22 [Parcubacteria group bacterium GW2011_GWE2_39_37]|uniref:Large ribosomal subunit protein uL22 n=1 Tax=Candidatus Falkowbacteria bacterium GW2011_GWF2_39_8 TaxID=1618642 RepID=A0A0G0T291_9BACT|nr:MAG: 50S ribosomal protein L22 [Parcubacteria group bacterium GW2011_GWE2_39_37]KKR31967.1 MAG: 50S ribosomal protein L22 [Candidatus Falkowbacteria bacterium GW2011_GWF2_39_8]